MRGSLKEWASLAGGRGGKMMGRQDLEWGNGEEALPHHTLRLLVES